MKPGSKDPLRKRPENRRFINLLESTCSSTNIERYLYLGMREMEEVVGRRRPVRSMMNLKEVNGVDRVLKLEGVGEGRRRRGQARIEEREGMDLGDETDGGRSGEEEVGKVNNECVDEVGAVDRLFGMGGVRGGWRGRRPARIEEAAASLVHDP